MLNDKNINISKKIHVYLVYSIHEVGAYAHQQLLEMKVHVGPKTNLLTSIKKKQNISKSSKTESTIEESDKLKNKNLDKI